VFVTPINNIYVFVTEEGDERSLIKDVKWHGQHGSQVLLRRRGGEEERRRGGEEERRRERVYSKILRNYN